jgi:MFS family permease
VHIAPYATDIGISAAGAATILSILGGATIVGQIGLGSIGDRIGYKRAFLIGLVCVVVAALTLMLARQLWAFYLSAIFLGLAFGNCSTQESPMTAWLYGLTSHGIILGIFACSFTIGAAIGPLTFGYIFDVTGSYRYALWITSVLSIATVILTLFIKNTVTESALKTISAE